MCEITVGHQNVRSLIPHLDALKNIIISEGIGVLAVSETWLHRELGSELVHISGYDFLRRDYDGRGSGVGIYVSKEIKYTVLSTSFNIEHLCIRILTSLGDVAICVIYRRHHQDYRVFLDELENLITHCSLTCENVLLLGDFNIDLFKSELIVKSYEVLIRNLGLHQLITEPTRERALLDHMN